jgi:hypothetical protein
MNQQKSQKIKSSAQQQVVVIFPLSPYTADTSAGGEIVYILSEY